MRKKTLIFLGEFRGEIYEKEDEEIFGNIGWFFFGKDDEIFGKVWRQFLMNKLKRLWRFFFFFF